MGIFGRSARRRRSIVCVGSAPIGALGRAVLGFAAALVLGGVAVPAARSAEPESAANADTAAVPKKDVGDVLGTLLGRKPVRTEVVEQPRAGLSITFLPSIGYNPSYGAFVGASVSIGGWLGDPATTDLS